MNEQMNEQNEVKLREKDIGAVVGMQGSVIPEHPPPTRSPPMIKQKENWFSKLHLPQRADDSGHKLDAINLVTVS